MPMTSNHESGEGDTIAIVSWPHYSAIVPFIHAYNCDILIDKSKIFACPSCCSRDFHHLWDSLQNLPCPQLTLIYVEKENHALVTDNLVTNNSQDFKLLFAIKFILERITILQSNMYVFAAFSYAENKANLFNSISTKSQLQEKHMIGDITGSVDGKWSC